MATHSSILAWEIPWMEEPGGLQSKGSQRVGHNLATEHTHTQTGRKETQSWMLRDRDGSVRAGYSELEESLRSVIWHLQKRILVAETCREPLLQLWSLTCL